MLLRCTDVSYISHCDGAFTHHPKYAILSLHTNPSMVRHVSQSSALCNPEDASRAAPKALTPQATYCNQTPESELHPPALGSPSERKHPTRPLKAQIIDTQNPDVISPRPEERALDPDCSRNMSVDLEKQDLARSNHSSRSGSSESTLDDEMCAGQEEENKQLLEQNALKILVRCICWRD